MRARWGLFAAIALAAPVASGSAHPAVSLGVDTCAGVDEASVAAQVKVELGADLAPEAKDVTRVKVRCEGPLLVLTVDDPITGKSLERKIDLGSAAPKARTRLLAIAIAELVSASWTELETNPTPVVAPAGPPPAPEAKAAVRDSVDGRAFAPRLAADVAFDAHGFPGANGTGLLLGIGTRFSTAHAGLGLSLDLVAVQGHGVTDLGEVSVDLVGAGAFATYTARTGPTRLQGGLGVRGGSARLGGVPRDGTVEGRSLRGAFLGPAGFVALDVRLYGPLIAVLGVESGVALVSVRALADGQRATTIGGLWLGGQLGLGVAL